MASVNKVFLMGNCGRDPEVRYAASGSAICNVSIATTSKRKDKDSGEIIEETQWHRIVFFDRLAEIAGEYLKKGSPVFIEGRLKYGKYTDKDGIERNTTDIVATEMQLLGGRRDEGAAPAPAPAQQGRPAAQQSRAPQRQMADMPDDDIPF